MLTWDREVFATHLRRKQGGLGAADVAEEINIDAQDAEIAQQLATLDIDDDEVVTPLTGQLTSNIQLQVLPTVVAPQVQAPLPAAPSRIRPRPIPVPPPVEPDRALQVSDPSGNTGENSIDDIYGDDLDQEFVIVDQAHLSVHSDSAPTAVAPVQVCNQSSRSYFLDLTTALLEPLYKDQH